MKTIGRKLPSDVQAAPSRMVKAMPVADEPLTLPKGAFVIMRKSGGLRFTSTETTVFRDGRVTRRAVGAGVAAQSREPAVLTSRQVRELRALLASSGLPALGAQANRRQNPDGYAYGIVARIGRKVHSAEAFDGSVPASVQPVIAALNSIGAAGDPG